MVCQDTIVDKLEPKGIGDDDDDAFWGVAARGTGDICVETVKLDNLPLGLLLMDGPLETFRTGHGVE